MTIRINICDGTGSGTEAKITNNNALQVANVVPEVPKIGSRNRYRFFFQKLDSVGDGTGITNQNVNGSSTPQLFFLNAVDEADIHITNIVIIISDSSVSHEKFGDVPALANGWDLIIHEEGEETNLIDAASTGGDVLAQSGIFNNYNDASSFNILAKRTSTTAALIANFPVSQIVPDGVRLGRSTLNHLESVVNDDLTGLTEFTVTALGYKHFPL